VCCLYHIGPGVAVPVRSVAGFKVGEYGAAVIFVVLVVRGCVVRPVCHVRSPFDFEENQHARRMSVKTYVACVVEENRGGKTRVSILLARS
jgi:hypothetical protein